MFILWFFLLFAIVFIPLVHPLTRPDLPRIDKEQSFQDKVDKVRELLGREE